jgi:hypothetical protein
VPLWYLTMSLTSEFILPQALSLILYLFYLNEFEIVVLPRTEINCTVQYCLGSFIVGICYGYEDIFKIINKHSPHLRSSRVIIVCQKHWDRTITVVRLGFRYCFCPFLGCVSLNMWLEFLFLTFLIFIMG